MVGVAGRSKGCNTCRRRRVKCDETKPVCLRCTKAHFECLGYERNRLWHHTSTAPFPAQPPASSQPAHSALPSPDYLDGSRAVSRIQSPPPELSLVAFQGDFYYAFMFANFVWRSYGTPWLDQAAEGRLGDLALDATKALAQANFGRSNRKPEIQLQGTALYGKCLRALAAELGNGSAPGELLVPILVLMMHAGAHEDRTGAIFHLRGTARLLFLCGPEAFQKQPLINAYEATRATLLMASLISRQRLFLEEERWRTVPWAHDPESKSPQSLLLDILVTIPGILQDHVTFEQTEYPEPGLYDRIFDCICSQLVALYEWRWRWQAQWGDQVSVDSGTLWRPAGPGVQSHRSVGPSQQSDRLRFSRFISATEIMLYNTALLWLLALLWKISPVGAGEVIEACATAASPPDPLARFVSFEPLRRPGAAVTVREPALEICRAFEWVSRHHSRGKEPTHLYLFPVGMAMSVLDREPEGKSWIQALLDASPVTANYAADSNPAGFGFYVTGQSLHPESQPPAETIFTPSDIAAVAC